MKFKNQFLIFSLAFFLVFTGFGLEAQAYQKNDKVLNKAIKEKVVSENLPSKSKGEQKIANQAKRQGRIKQSRRIKASRVAKEILVKYKNSKIDISTSAGQSAALSLGYGKSLEKKQEIREKNIQVWRIKDEGNIDQKILELKNDANVEYAQPNYQYYTEAIDTNDTYKDLLWGLDNSGQAVNGVSGTAGKDISAAEAWVISEQASTTPVIVAVIDTGVAYNHPDLAGNMWDGVNCKDENGAFLGGCNYGYDFEDNDKTPLPTSSSHGTHIAGTIAALKNNTKGIIGVAPQAKIMALKTSLTTIDNIKSINFAKENGAKIINASWGGPTFDQALKDAIEQFPGLFIAAAANGGGDGIGDNNDITPNYPSDYNLDNIISVAATDQNDNLASFSNYGATAIDVAAPGVNIYSAIANENVLNENFETTVLPSLPAGWSKEGAGNNWGTYDLGDGSGWGKVIYGDLAYPYANNTDSSVTSPIYNLGNGASLAAISFWTKCDTEYVTNGWVDYMQLEYSADGINFTPAIDPYFGDEFRWDEATLDILNEEDPLNSAGQAAFHYEDIAIPSEYLTSNFKFRFRWVTNGSDNDYDGCSIDDIVINKFSDGSDEKYGFMNGTSMATPHVAGLVALVSGYNSSLTNAQIKTAILNSGDALASLAGKTVSGKRINAQKTLEAVNPAKAILSFAIPNQIGTTTINQTDFTIALAMPFGTNLTSLEPAITISGATISPSSSLAQDFSNSVVYTVIAADSSTQNYTVAVSIEPDTIGEAFASMANSLTTNGIYNNLNTVNRTNYTNFSGLYFEKKAGISSSSLPLGRITFSALDLSASSTQSFLENISAKLEIATGSISLDLSEATSTVALKNAGATLKFYGLDALGFNASTATATVNSRLIAFDDNNNYLDKAELINGEPAYLGACEVGGGCYAFTVSVNHFTEYRIDNTAPTVVKLGNDSADVVLQTGTTSLAFSEALNSASKLAVQNALSSGADKALSYSWSGASLIITATSNTTFANDISASISDLAGNTTSNALLIDSKYDVVVPPSGGGGGGGGGSAITPVVPTVVYCSAVDYGAWTECVNNHQYRQYINISPANCQLTLAQQEASKQTCVAIEKEVAKPVEIVKIEKIEIKPVVENKPIVRRASSLPVEPAFKLAYTPLSFITEVLNKFSKKGEVLGLKKYANGTLLKDSSNKIYLVQNDRLVIIASKKELAKYKNKKTIKVSDDIINRYSK